MTLQTDPQYIQLDCKGLYTMPNSLSQVPKGSLLQAQNVVVDYNGLLNIRRGIKQFGTDLSIITGSPNTELFQEFFYKGTKLIWFGDVLTDRKADAAHYLAYDSDQLGTWVLTTHPFPAAAYALTDTYRTVQSNDNIYFTSIDGLLKTDDPSHALYSAGGLPGLDGSAALVDSAGFLPDSTAVAYRMTWTSTDFNNNAVEGTPSTRIVTGNSSGHSSNVNLTYTIPIGATVNDQYTIYRSVASASATTDPGDELQQIIQGNPTSGQIAARSFTIKDTVPQTELGAFLYTNSGEEGISQANNIPPLANDICFYKGYVIFGAATTQQKLLLSLLATGSPNGLQIGDTFTVVNGIISVVLTAASSENISLNEFKVFTGGDPGSDILDTKLSLIHVLNLVSDNTLVYGYDASDANSNTALPGDFFLQEQNIGGGVFNVFSSRTTAWNPVLIPILVFTITTVVDMTHLTVSSTVGISNGDTIVQGSALTTVTSVVDATHLIVTDSTGFTATTASDISVGSDSLAGGGLGMGYCSKFQQPEAVPTANTINVGNPNFEWLRCLPLRDSVVVLKSDGLFQLTGETFPFTVTTLDTGTILTAPESPAVMNNQVFAFTNQGVVAIAETGPAIISRPIENILQQISSYLYPNFPIQTFGTPYETDRKYLMSTISTIDSYTRATIQYVYDTITESWTTYRYPVPVWDILESPTEHRLYVCSGDPTYPYLFQERKSFTRLDFADIELPVTITSFVGTTVNVTDSSNITVGWGLVQYLAEADSQPAKLLNIANVLKIVSSTQIIISKPVTWDLTMRPITRVVQPIPVKVQYCPITGTSAVAGGIGNPGIIKFFKEIQLMFQDANFTAVTLNFGSDFISGGPGIMLPPINPGVGWGGGAWGSIPWGGNANSTMLPIRTYIPLYARRAHWLTVELRLSEAMTNFTYAGCVVCYVDTTTRSK